jgi:hypothetical protein
LVVLSIPLVPTIFFLVKFFWQYLPEKRPEAAPVAATEPASGPAKQASTAAGPCKWSWNHFEVPEGKAVELYLKRGWKLDPDGPTHIFTPKGKLLRDPGPGANVNFGHQPEGTYTFQSDPLSEGRRIRVWSCFTEDELE